MSSKRRQQQQQQNKVSFGGITIREYGIELGDHPCATGIGAPLTIGWNVQETYSHKNLELYEYMNSMRLESEGRHRKCGKELIIPAFERNALLLRAGYREDQLEHAIKQMHVVKVQRGESRQDDISKIDGNNNNLFNKLFKSMSIKRRVIDPIQKSIAAARTA